MDHIAGKQTPRERLIEASLGYVERMAWCAVREMRAFLGQWRHLWLVQPMVDDLLVGRTRLTEHVVVTGAGEVSQQALQLCGDLEALDCRGDDADVLQLGQHETVEVVGDVSTQEPVRTASEVLVQPAQLTDERP